MTATPSIQTDEQKAAKQLEAFFLRRLLAEARPQAGMLDGGFAGDTFKQMLDEAISDKMSSAGGIGMAEMFENQLAGKGAPVAAHVPVPLQMPPTTNAIPDLEPGKLAMPAIGRLSSGYGMRIDPIHHAQSMHPGLDVAAPAGTYGNLVTIQHANGLETRYAHLSSVDVQKGAEVLPGTPIGKVGSTGRSTGPHLHFEVREDGKLQDPSGYLPLNSSGKLPSR